MNSGGGPKAGVREALEKLAGTSEKKEVKDRVRRNWAWEKEERGESNGNCQGCNSGAGKLVF